MNMQDREHVYELVETDGTSENDVVWWNPKKRRIEGTSEFIVEYLKANFPYIGKVSFKDGTDYLDALPLVYNNGYMQAVRIG